MKFTDKFVHLTKALVFSIGFTFLMSVGHHLTEIVLLKRIFVLLGGDFFNGGYIQLLTYIAFLWSLLEIFQMLRDIEKENKVFKKKLLPTEERHLLLPTQINDIYIKAAEQAQNKKSLLTDMIKKSCLKFRATKSIPEMIEIISIQTEINKEISESDQSNIKYLTWVIPSIGFIGTVLGISQSLMIANSGDMNLITAKLGVAFDTTLVSLILSIIVMWYYHKLTKETDYLHAHLKGYIIENLINRIEID